MTVSAPGKLLLFGEHAVVYRYPSLVTAVDQRLSVTIEKYDKPGLAIIAPQVKDTRFVDAVVALVGKKYDINPDGIALRTASPFSGIYGFGSSSAVTVATLKALCTYYQKSVSDRELFDLAFQIVLAVQGTGSGFDVAAAIYGGTLLYGKGGEPLEMVPLDMTDVDLIVGYSGIKSNTVDIVKEVARKREQYPERVERIFGGIAQLVGQAHEAIKARDWQTVGKLMNFNQDYLRDLGVSTEKLETLVSVAKKAGAYGAKLSGAGGGDCMIALAPKNTTAAVTVAIIKAGGEVVPIAVNAQGVRVETTDNQQEYFVVVDQQDTVLGYRTRYDCHHDKMLIHRGVSLLIFDMNGQVLLQKRSLTKDTYPGYWSTSVGGHVEKDESYEQTVMRETKEELGVALPVEFCEKFIHQYPEETEMEALFTAHYDGQFHPDTREVDEVQFFSCEEIAQKVTTGQLLLTDLTRVALQKVGYLV